MRMAEHLLQLLKDIGLKEDNYPLFADADIQEIKHYQNEDRYEFVIEISDYLPIDVYDFVLNNIQKAFAGDSQATVVFKVRNRNTACIKEFFPYALRKVLGNSPLVEIYSECGLEVEDEVVHLVLANKAEKQKIDTIKKSLVDFLEVIGFDDFGLKITIDEKKNSGVLDDIEKQILQVAEEKPKKVIFGSEIKTKAKSIEEIVSEENNVTIEGYVFVCDFFETKKNNLKIITLKVTDYTNSIYAKIFINDTSVYHSLRKKIKAGMWYRLRGYSKKDSFAKEIVLNVRDVNRFDKKDEIKVDNAPKRRVELHAHTHMSQMDGMASATKLIKHAQKMGHNAIAITDHNSVQSFPEAYNLIKYSKDDFKVIFGCEMTMINDEVKIINQNDERDLEETTYVVFDLETTGFNAGANDQIIEIGAVKMQRGEVKDTFSCLVDPKREISEKITEITKITNEMLKGKKSEEEAVKKFMAWCGDAPLVAHNAKFDHSFLERAFNIYDLGEFKNTLIDTLELSRALESNQAKHSLSALVKRYAIPFDETEHHRAEYDARVTALIYQKMLRKVVDQNYEKISDLQKLVSQEEIFKFGRSFHINILCKNKTGLRNLFKLVSYANTDYFYKTARIPRSVLQKHREGLLISSGCYLSEVFVEAKSKTDEELRDIITFYDFIELQPIELYDHLLQIGEFETKEEIIATVKKIITAADEAGVLVVVSGDVHHLTTDDKIYREIIIHQKVPGGGLHPLARNNITNIPSFHFRTTEEMLSSFAFLPKEKAHEIVVENSNVVADKIEKFEVIIDTGGLPFTPKIKDADKKVRQKVYEQAQLSYGEKLPVIVAERIEDELKGIIGGGFDVIYLISQQLVQKSLAEGYLVGSRGSVGSSLVATLMGITEVNPLPPHYVCPNCKLSLFELDGVFLGSKYSSGYDLPDKKCPSCDENLYKEGHDMPFATFLGLNANKVPDIDLNFSGEYQLTAHEYTKELFGSENVLRAGTIGTVAEKTAFGFVKGYLEDKNIIMRKAEVDRLAFGCAGVKRTTGQHPGGIIVIPDYKDVFDFTPYQYPADDIKSPWRTSHFDYHAIDENLLKLDILGHDDPTMLRMLGDLSGLDVTKIDLADEKVMQIFLSPDVFGVSKEKIMCETGTLGVPEFGTRFVIAMLLDTKPKTFGELVKISGLSHGTDVWLSNAQELIRNNVCSFHEVIGCRDDIMIYLTYNGLSEKDAFQIMEFVRKGKAGKEPEKWREFERIMYENNIPDWYINACYKIKYMFPKAHAVAYVMSALRIAWFKVHQPINYYAAYFSVRCYDLDIETIYQGYEAVYNLIIELDNKGYEITNKEQALRDDMHIALEAIARGIKFAPIDLEKSDAMNFIVLDENTLLPPFRVIEGLGDLVAKKIVKERENQPFISVEDLQKRGKVNATTIEKMRFMGILDHLDESSQLSLF